MEQRAFGGLVAEAVARLYDYPYLQTHALGRLLVREPSGELRGRALQRVLCDAIQALRPSAGASGDAHAWRIYRYLFLRYVQALAPGEVADQLGISQRQARRSHREAMAALTSVLWDRYPIEHPPTAAEPLADAAASSSPDEGAAALESEVANLASAGHGGETDLAEVVASLRSILDTLARRHGWTWSAGLGPRLPRVAADRAIVRQIVLALCTGLLEHRRGDLRLGARPGPDAVALALRARWAAGPAPPGPAPERLAIARRLVEAEGGSLELRHDGAAVEVVVALPRARRPRVLVVDDNPDVVAVFRRYLETAGLEALEARSGPEGFRLAREARPAAITLDVMMASQDGWETLQLLKNHPETQAIPVIICSVLPEAELALALGAAEALRKPLTRAALLGALARHGVGSPGAARPGSAPGSAPSRPSRARLPA